MYLENTVARAPRFRLLIAMITALFTMAAAPAPDKPGPKVGDAAPAVELSTLKDESVSLAKLRESGPVVVMFLRGYPGYQCPLCTRQVGEFLKSADAFKGAGATVLMIYPGPSDGLKKHAEEFLKNKPLPDHYKLVTDPDYVATNAWKVRWNAARETAYPSTFVVDKEGVIRFAKVSTEHGDRSNPKEVIEAIKALK
jgi:thioredoxin-dependent peroxiredoxin